MKLFKSRAQFRRSSECQVVLPLSLRVISFLDAPISNVVLERLVGVIILDNLALGTQNSRDHRHIFTTDLLTSKLFIALMLVDHSFALRNRNSIDLPGFLKQARTHGFIIWRLTSPWTVHTKLSYKESTSIFSGLREGEILRLCECLRLD